MRFLLNITIFWAYVSVAFASQTQIQVVEEIDLGTIASGVEYEISVGVTNTSVMDAKITTIQAFATMDTLAPIYRSINAAANSTSYILYKFTPTHNIDYEIYLYNLVEHWDNAYPVATRVIAKVTHANHSVYDFTNNLWGSDLLNSLSAYLKNHTSFTYKKAREFLWTSFDNDKGTVECIYTGKTVQVVGEPDFAELDKSGFNTEHSWPRSYGSDYEPPLSDMNHIFPSSKTANDRRANFPYNYVTGQISWQDGGSKLGIDPTGKTAFEPRNEVKGNIARALLYFALRYDNPFKFIDAQEAVLREWVILDPPDEKEMRRNDSIAAYQLKRNPFIDHPSFLERIYSISSDPNFELIADPNHIGTNFTININTIDEKFDMNLWVHNQGNGDVEVKSFKLNYPDYLKPYIDQMISSDKIILAKSNKRASFELIKPEYLESNSTITATITLEDDSFFTWDIELIDGLTSVENYDESEAFDIEIFPNPSSSSLTIKTDIELELVKEISIYDVNGKMIDKSLYQIGITDNRNIFLDTKKLKSFGNVFIIRFVGNKFNVSKKFIIIE
ncbi:MAG: hypothetical protein CVV22_05015 [Ignavibacteriae bacterium HGW-Ignavibacteriae-1]|jgi:endonuclease I|nr:MAG: hypothetical protein CVV22_05015 [Ignavibacteriae bacterium HGW-Ignavibacteriae-1]